MRLPIDPLLPEIVAALRATNRVVLRAAPGAGKTTRVPAALLDAGVAGDQQVVVLEPRRIAARAAAEFVAAARGGSVGGEVGYRVRFEQRGGAATRLWFLTEGVLGRQLARDPFLERVGVLVLDEFHERHLHGDVALALARELQMTVRPDLKLVVMSATLETDPLAAYLPDCAVLTSEGRAYPVAIEFAATADDRPLAGRVTAALRQVLADGGDTGDVLVFLPGAAEIRRAAQAIEPLAAAHRLLVLPLHGDLPLDAQQRALRRAAQRKVVLATNVAETSLTIDGVTAVIDSGLARVARFDPRHGVNGLRLAAISRAAAEQRAGRAGRTAPGRCLRLWTAAEHAGRLEREVPEIRRLELSATLLELRAWGLRDVRSFAWLDAPPAGALARAERLLGLLGAIDAASGAPTATGRRLLAMPVAPRLGRLLLEAEQRGRAADGALLAALASERDICLEARAFGAGGAPFDRLRANGASDLLLRADLYAEAQRAGFNEAVCARLALDRVALRNVERASRQLLHGGRPLNRRASTSSARTDSSPGALSPSKGADEAAPHSSPVAPSLSDGADGMSPGSSPVAPSLSDGADGMSPGSSPVAPNLSDGADGMSPGSSPVAPSLSDGADGMSLGSSPFALSLSKGVPSSRDDDLLRCTLAGFPDRVVRRRAAGSARGVMVGGSGVVLDERSGVRAGELFVAVEVEGGKGVELRVRLASAIEPAWLVQMFPHAWRIDDEIVFDDEQQRVVRRQRECFHDLVLRERISADVDRSVAGPILAAAARRDPAAAVALGEAELGLLARLQFLQRWMPELGLPADRDALLADAVAALCDGKRSLAELRRAAVGDVMRGLLSRAQLAALEREAPTHYALPTGRNAAVDYAAERPPSFAARIQEVFGLRATPRLAGGRVPLVIHLLAPSQRPIQITDDLASFWRTTYAEVRKELRGRYPKHPWPDDPLTAPPTARAKRPR